MCSCCNELPKAMIWLERLESLEWSMRVFWSKYNLQLERLVCTGKWHTACPRPGHEFGVWGYSMEMWSCPAGAQHAHSSSGVGLGNRNSLQAIGSGRVGFWHDETCNLKLYIVLYVCKGRGKLGQNWGYSFLKMDHSLLPHFFPLGAKTSNLFLFPQRQSL